MHSNVACGEVDVTKASEVVPRRGAHEGSEADESVRHANQRALVEKFDAVNGFRGKRTEISQKRGLKQRDVQLEHELGHEVAAEVNNTGS